MEYSIAVQTYCGLKSASALLNHLWCPARWFASRHLIVASAAAGFYSQGYFVWMAWCPIVAVKPNLRQVQGSFLCRKPICSRVAGRSPVVCALVVVARFVRAALGGELNQVVFRWLLRRLCCDAYGGVVDWMVCQPRATFAVPMTAVLMELRPLSGSVTVAIQAPVTVHPARGLQPSQMTAGSCLCLEGSQKIPPEPGS